MTDLDIDSNVRGAFERHAQSVLAGIVLIAVGWVGFTLNDLTKTAIRLEGANALTNAKLDSLAGIVKSTAESSYTISQASSDLRMIQGRMETNERRIMQLEQHSGAP